MSPRCLPANGVPWLLWIGRDRWACRACGGSGRQAPFISVAAFARWAGDLKRAHAACGPDGGIALGDDQVGHPLNPDRAER